MPYHHLTSEERYCIAHMHSARYSFNRIARITNRSVSTISREIKRNTNITGSYWYDVAQNIANKRKKQPRSEKRRTYTPLYELVNLSSG